MGETGKILNRITRAADLMDEPIPGCPLVEILDNRRVLIEHHRGVCEYSQTFIRVKVKFGSVCVCGSCLELSKMSKSMLIISGNIESIHLGRG